jgi:hypothetical protein
MNVTLLPDAKFYSDYSKSKTVLLNKHGCWNCLFYLKNVKFKPQKQQNSHQGLLQILGMRTEKNNVKHEKIALI